MEAYSFTAYFEKEVFTEAPVHQEGMVPSSKWSPLRQEPEAPLNNATSRGLRRITPGRSRGIASRGIQNPVKVEPQEHNRYRYWGIIDELEGHVLRVVTLEDKRTIHNAFPDRGYKP